MPLPSSVENHQLRNAIFYQKNFSFLIEEKDLNMKLINLIEKLTETIQY